MMGGYGFSPVVEIVLVSAVDEILRTSRQPILICRQSCRTPCRADRAVAQFDLLRRQELVLIR
jgi:hypothetical protein